MMTSHHRLQLLAEACTLPCVKAWMGTVTKQDLEEWLTSELGNTLALDDFHPHGTLHSKAVAPKKILHIVSGNTPHAAIQSLLRGLLLGSHNIIKLPSSGLPEFPDCIGQFPAELRSMVEIHVELIDDHWSDSDAVVAIGSDATIAAVYKKVQPHQIFIPHSHKISIGVILDDFKNAAPLAARDVSLYNQQGCLSPHALYVKGDSHNFAELLALAMADFSAESLPPPLNLSDSGAVRNLRELTRFQTANDPASRLWESPNSLDWTVIHDPSPELKLSCLNRCIYVKPLPEQFSSGSLGSESKHLSTIALHPFDQDTAANLTSLPAHRICPLGQSQQPSLFWHHDGFAPLASLVRWKDIG